MPLETLFVSPKTIVRMAYFADLITKGCGACACMNIRAFLNRDFRTATQTFYALKYGHIFESSDIVIMLL